MTTLRYGITCSYIATIVNLILALAMFSVFLQFFNTFIPNQFFELLDPVTEWFLENEFFDLDKYTSSVVFFDYNLYSLILQIGSILLLVSFLTYIVGLTNYNTLRKAAVMGLIGCIIVFSEFRYSGDNAYALILLALFLNISVWMAVPKISDQTVEKARDNSLAEGELDFGENKSQVDLTKDRKALEKLQAKMDRLGEGIYETVPTDMLDEKKGSRHRETESADNGDGKKGAKRTEAKDADTDGKKQDGSGEVRISRRRLFGKDENLSEESAENDSENIPDDNGEPRKKAVKPKKKKSGGKNRDEQ